MFFQLCKRNIPHPGSEFYSLAKSFNRDQDIVNSIRCYCNAFFFRNNKAFSIDKNFFSFYEIQMSIYLLGKKQLDVSYCEGDMIYALIESKWEDIRDYIGLFNDPRKLYKLVRIDFPFDLEIEEDQRVGHFLAKTS